MCEQDSSFLGMETVSTTAGLNASESHWYECQSLPTVNVTSPWWRPPPIVQYTRLSGTPIPLRRWSTDSSIQVWFSRQPPTMVDLNSDHPFISHARGCDIADSKVCRVSNRLGDCEFIPDQEHAGNYQSQICSTRLRRNIDSQQIQSCISRLEQKLKSCTIDTFDYICSEKKKSCDVDQC